MSPVHTVSVNIIPSDQCHVGFTTGKLIVIVALVLILKIILIQDPSLIIDI
jgi:hypothetical protein